MVPGTKRLDPRTTRLLICDELDPVALEILAERGYEPEVRTGLSPAELAAAVPGVHALVVRSATRITREVVQAADELRVVGRAGVGVDNVDVDAATERGIVVMNTPTGNVTTTAELAIALLVALARHLPRADRTVRSGRWSKKGLVGTEITGKTLGVVGLGRIGRLVAERALGLRMHVIAHDPFLTGESPLPGVELVELETLLGASDFVSLHVPATDATRNLLSRERIALMKSGARLINAARGGLVDEAALCVALDEGRLAGAAFDVLSEEPPTAEHPLLARDDVVLTPHLGASSAEAQRAVAVDIAHQIADFLADGIAHNAVNAPATSAQVLQEIGPYVVLAEKAGSFLAQLLDGPVRKLELTLAGEIARTGHEHVPLALLTGVLRQSQDEGVNFVNATLLAKERDIRLFVSESDDAAYYPSQIKVRASTQGGKESHVVAGTVFGRTPRLTRVDDMHLDLEPRGTLLITRHADRPGVVGGLGTVLGRHGVNIKRIELGPPDASAEQPDLATGFLSLYEEPSAEAIAELRALDPIRAVHLIRL